FSQSRHHYDAGTGVRSIADLHDVLAFFQARRGSLHAFRFRDPFDMKSCRPEEAVSPTDQTLGVGDGARARIQLVKIYGEGEAAYAGLIGRPLEATLRSALDGAEIALPARTASPVCSGTRIWRTGVRSRTTTASAARKPMRRRS